MKRLMKTPLIVAAIVVVLRVVLEQAGTPDAISNLVSAAALYLLIFPIYFGVRIAASGDAHPYKTLFKTVGVYAAAVRLMIVPTYWLAYIYQWPAARFSVQNGGVVGPDVTPLTAYLVTPVIALIAWVLFSVVIGGAIGSAIIALKRRTAVRTAA
jgi:hypothetical protein